MTVLSLLEYTGESAMLSDGFSSGVTPFTVQYSGRHDSHWKVKTLKTEFEEPGTTGKIQFGAKPGPSAQVIVPAFCVPLAAAGTEPIAPGTVTAPEEVLPDELLLLLQAASAVMLATAMAIPPIVLLRNLIIGPPSLPCPRLLSVLGSSACRPSEVVSPVIRSAPSRALGRSSPATDCGPFPRHIRADSSRAGR